MWSLWLAVAWAGSPVHLDVGSLGGPRMEGFDRLHPDGSDEPRARWTTPPKKTFTRDHPDALTGDGALGGTLHLDLEAGLWHVWTLLGDSREAPFFWAGASDIVVRSQHGPILRHKRPTTWEAWQSSRDRIANPRPRFHPDETVWERQIAVAHPWREGTVEVGEDGLDLTVDGQTLQAVVAYPASRRADASRFLTAVDAARRATFLGRYAPWYLEHQTTVPPEGPLTVQQATWRERPDRTRGTRSPQLDLIAAAGTATSTLLFLHGGDAPGRWILDVPRDAPTLEIDEVTWLDNAGHTARTLEPRPSVLVGAESGWEGGQGMVPALSVRVDAAEDHPPGRWDATLTLERGDDTVRLPIRIDVPDLDLVAGIPTGFFYKVPRDATLKAGFGSTAVRDLVTQAFDLMSSRGLTATSLRHALWPGRQPGGHEPYDDQVLAFAANAWRARGGELLLWSDPKEEVRTRAYAHDTVDPLPQPLADAMKPALASAAAHDAVIHLYEEEAGKHLSSVVRGPELAHQVRDASESPVSLFATLPLAVEAPVASAYDVVALGPSRHVSPERVAAARSRGARVWAYNLSPGRTGPLLAWALAVDAHLQWHFAPVTGDPYYTARWPIPWFYSVIDPHGRVRGTTQLEEFAAGVVDARLLATLEATVRTSYRRSAQPRAKAAESFLATTRRTLLAAQPGPDGELLPPHAAEAVRRAALTWLERLRAP